MMAILVMVNLSLLASQTNDDNNGDDVDDADGGDCSVDDGYDGEPLFVGLTDRADRWDAVEEEEGEPAGDEGAHDQTWKSFSTLF